MRSKEFSRVDMASTSLVKSYEALRKKVQETLVLGQRKIEEAKVRTYWETGRLISEPILYHKDRAEYGRRTLERLSRDLAVGTRLLERTLQFFRQFREIPSGRTELTWSHYRALLTVPEEKKRLEFIRKAVREEWISEELEAAIRKAEPLQLRSLKPVRGEAELLPVPQWGRLNTYQLKDSNDTVWPDKNVLLLDHGFKSYRALTSEESRGLKTGDVVEWTGAKFLKNGRTSKDLYAYTQRRHK